MFAVGCTLGLLVLSTFLSPLHATFILFADFVYDHTDSSKEWISFAISVAMWVSIFLLYYLITVKLIKQDKRSNRYIIQTVIIYLIAYLPSTSFVMYYIVTYGYFRDKIFLFYQVFLFGL